MPFPQLLSHQVVLTPGADPQWCWVEAKSSTEVVVWWSDRGTDEDEWQIQRSEDNRATWIDVETALPSADKVGFTTTWKGGQGNPSQAQTFYIDTTAPVDTMLWYRIRGLKMGGVEPTGWAESWNFVVTPPNDEDPARSHWFLVNTNVPKVKGDVHTPIRGNLQSLLDGGTVDGKILKRGDIIELDPAINWADITYTFRKWATDPTGDRNKDFAVIRTKSWSKLPKKNNRAHFSDIVHMPLFRPNIQNTGAIELDKGANYFWFQGLHFHRWTGATNSGVGLLKMYALTDADITNDERDGVCNNIIIDQCLFDGSSDPTQQQGIGVEMFADYGAVINCNFRHMKLTSTDGADIFLNNCYGPARIENNGSTSPCPYHVQIGGTGQRGPGMSTADWRVYRNYLVNPDQFNNQDLDFNFLPVTGQFTFSDVEIDGSNDKLIERAASAVFTGVNIGDAVKITGGTGFVTGTYLVRDVNILGGVATQLELDRTVGTLGSTAGSMLHTPNPYRMRALVEVELGLRWVIEENYLEGGGFSGEGCQIARLTPLAAGEGVNDRHHWAKAAFDGVVRFNYVKDVRRSIVLRVDHTGLANTVSLGSRRLTIENNMFEVNTAFDHFLIDLYVEGGSLFRWTGLKSLHNTFYVPLKPAGLFGNDNTGRGFLNLVIGNTERPGVLTGQLIGNIVAVGTYGARVSAGTLQDNGPGPSFDLVFDPAVEVRDNVWINIDSSVLIFPQGDFVPLTYTEVFRDPANSNFDVFNSYSGLVNPAVVTGQTKPGCNFPELQKRIKGVRTGVPREAKDKRISTAV